VIEPGGDADRNNLGIWGPAPDTSTKLVAVVALGRARRLWFPVPRR
jgi:hypothetical protein